MIGVSLRVISAIILTLTFGTSGAVLKGPIYHPVTGNTYYLLGQSTWTEAEAEAVAMGGHLVTVEDELENNWLCTTFSTNLQGQLIALWIGLNDRESEGNFNWASGILSGFAKWTPGEPNNNGDEDYTFLSPVPLTWYDVGNINNFAGTPLHGVVEIYDLECGGESIMEDTFVDGHLDLNKWTVTRGSPGTNLLTEDARLVFRNNSGLAGKPLLPESYSIGGILNFTGTNNEFRIVTRSDLSTYGVSREATGIEIGFSDQRNTLYIREANRPALASISYPFTTNKLYRFRITDDGNLVQVYINDMSSSLLAFWTPYRTGANFVLYGGIDANSEIMFDHIQVCTLFAPLTIHRAIELEVQTLPNYPYQVQASSDLILWNDIGTAFRTTGYSTNLFFRAEQTPQFYRIITR